MDKFKIKKPEKPIDDNGNYVIHFVDHDSKSVIELFSVRSYRDDGQLLYEIVQNDSEITDISASIGLKGFKDFGQAVAVARAWIIENSTLLKLRIRDRNAKRRKIACEIDSICIDTRDQLKK